MTKVFKPSLYIIGDFSGGQRGFYPLPPMNTFCPLELGLSDELALSQQLYSTVS